MDDASLWPMPERGAWPAEPDRHDVIVVGAGIGGLTAGALLAKRGFKVLVVEAHNRPGGYCSCWTRTVGCPGGPATFHFDAGIQDFSGLGARGPLRRLLSQLEAEPRIDWRRVRHFYKADGIGFTVPETASEMAADLGLRFPAESAGIAAFFLEMEAVYRELYADIESTGGVPVPPRTIEGMLNWSAGHPHAGHWMRQKFLAMLNTFLADRRLKTLLTTLADYITDRPETLSVGDMAPLFGYYFDGGYYPAGGSQRLADVLSEVIAEQGGRVLLRTRVKRILIEDGRVAGIESAIGGIHHAPVVIANGDVVSALTDLVGESHLPSGYLANVLAMRRGPSAVLVSLGLDTVPDLPARVFVHQDGLGFGIGNPSVIDPSLAPPGHAALTMVCLLSEAAASGWRRKDSGYQAAKQAFADRLIAATEASVMPALRRHIIHCEVASPPSFTLFAKTRNGNIYGADRDQWHPQIKSPVAGLLLVGAGTSTGPGVEAVVISGTMAADIITGQQEGVLPNRTRGMREMLSV
jgi:phytoene dehydrogenase-like protein